MGELWITMNDLENSCFDDFVAIYFILIVSYIMSQKQSLTDTWSFSLVPFSQRTNSFLSHFKGNASQVSQYPQLILSQSNIALTVL